jgi:hypothetical protein
MGGALPRAINIGAGAAALFGGGSSSPSSPAPSAPVVSQSSATDASAQNSVRRGKSPAILTSPYGLDPNATLGKPTLLGS